MSARKLITDHLDLWTGAVTQKRSGGRGNNGKIELTGIKKLRELILELAVRGKLVDQDPSNEPASVLLARIAEEKARLVKKGKIKKPKKLPEITEDEKPFELPEGWQWARLSDVLRVINGRAYKKHEMLQEGTPLLRVGNLFTSNEWYYSDLQLEDDKYIDHGDLIYAWSASFGPFIWDGGRAIYHYHIWKLELFDGLSTNKLFLYNYLKAVTEEIKSSGSGIAMVHMTKAKMEELVVPLPPHEEQLRIVEKVDELMALCDRLEQQVGDQLEAHEVLVDTLLDALTRSADAAEVAENWARIAEHFDTLFTTEASIDKLKQAILQLAVMGRLVEQDPNDEPASVLLERIAEEKARLVKEGKIRKQKPLPEIAHDEYPFEIPSGWAMSRMDDITNIISGIAKGKKLSGKKAVWVPYLRVANVQRGALDLSEVKEIEMACDEVEKYTVEKRDLLITEGGDWDKVGRTAIWNADIKPMTHQNHVFRARLILGEQNEHWIEKYLNSGIAREYFANSSKQTTNLASINKTQLRSCIVPVPPLDEQQRIVDKVDELMALCDQLKNRLAEAGETRNHLAEAVVEQAVN
ncbi:restriction endonuclease subunit S [Halomonas alkalicola]|uniref:restriction endonuclease subunit S n=1 Tax=Halomonas alkalicola TaxID=1930622 RepID=UPI0026600BC4|nr:restriction endonuclease subunit S [Halomonas alkalicola]